ncbi:hypothetical protein Taro_043009 [Colocasia esculenta]|uniref:Uncharacterized protein n=1 Tax=Colocasia esculenta TaxID=4460 RepID=A0A843WJW0_COLES|nr:hypothetical protein [Colocasia esculenta]
MDFYRVLDPHIPLLSGARSVFSHRQELDVNPSCRQDLQSAASDLAVNLLEWPDTAVKFFTVASRGRRGGVSAREGEQRREEQVEQQAPAPQGPVLPPPPPVDYGVFMQGES